MKRGIGAVVVLLGALVLVFAGCATTDTSNQESQDSGATTGSEFNDGASSSAPAPVKTATISDLETVYFDFDQSSIRSESVATLRSNATAINSNTSWGKIKIQGHTDERGSAQYNLALGERRASAVKRYLIDLGVSASRLTVVSFGEAVAAVPGHDESAWRYNRRTEFAN